MAKRSLKAVVRPKPTTTKKITKKKTTKAKKVSAPTPKKTEPVDITSHDIKFSNQPALTIIPEYEHRISKLEGQIEVLLTKPIVAGTNLITPSKVDSILREKYGLPVQADVKKLVSLVKQKVKDPEHAYFIIRHQRDKKLLASYYSILTSGMEFPLHSTEVKE